MIDRPRTTGERISLLVDTFSDSGETEVVKHLRGDDAQLFVDVVYEVHFYSLTRNDTTDRDLKFPVSLSRCWTVYRYKSGAGV